LGEKEMNKDDEILAQDTVIERLTAQLLAANQRADEAEGSLRVVTSQRDDARRALGELEEAARAEGQQLREQLLAANQRADEAEGERDTYKRGYEGREKAKQMWFEKKQMADKRVQELEQELARKTAAFESYGKTLMGDTGDLYTHIGHIIGKYSSDKNAVHDLQTIDNLLAALTADRDEWKEQHENLLEMYRQSQGQLSLAQTELEQVKEMHIDAEAARDDYANTINDLSNVAWQRVYGGGKTDWEYPVQAIRHLVQLCDEKDKEVEAVRGELERYRYHHGLAEKARQNDACTECKGSGEIGYMTETELGPEGDSAVCHICAGSGSYRVAEVIASWGDTEEIADLTAKLFVAESSLAALQARATTDREWQSIESAPKDGTSILLIIPEAMMNFVPPVYVGAYDAPTKAWYTYGASSSGTCWRGDPTHWQPLPPLPVATAGERGMKDENT
jgi:hypothetical protein